MKVRKVISGIIASALLFSSIPVYMGNIVPDVPMTANAANEEEYITGTYESLTYKKYNDHVEISDCDNSISNVIIPSHIENRPVTAIASCAFMSCSNIISIEIPPQVRVIDNSAFYNCTSLISITIPETVETFGDHAFSFTPWLEEKQAENSLVIVNDILIDGRDAFGNVIIPANVKKISSFAFPGCLAIDSITVLNPECEIYDDVHTIYNRLVRGLSGELIPYFDGVLYGYRNSTIKAYASKYSYNFKELKDGYSQGVCNYLTYNRYDDHVEITGTTASYQTSYIIPAEIDGLKVTAIAESAFEDKSRLLSVTIPDTVKSIGKNAFNGCSQLGNIIIPKSVTDIDMHAFMYCSNLNITIKNSDCNIYNRAETICSSFSNNEMKYVFYGTINGYENSTAQAYAEKYGYTFISISEETEYKTGDINADGEIGIADFLLLSKHILAESALTAEQGERANLIKDNRIDVFDIIELRKLILDNIGNI